MSKKPKGIQRDKMTPEVRQLWDLGDFTRLTIRELAGYVGVPPSTLYYWFAGMKPRRAHELLILGAMRQIVTDHPLSEMEKVYPTFGPSPVQKLADDENHEAKAADEDALDAEDALLARIREAGAKLKASVSGSEADQLGEAWPSFVRVCQALNERGIKFEV